MTEAGSLASLLDSSSAFDGGKVQTLDQAIRALYGTDAEGRRRVHGVLTQLQSHPDAWRLVQTILLNTTEENTRFFALNILQTAIKTRWNVLPTQEKQAIPKYLTELSTMAALDASCSPAFRTKINEALVEVARRTWPTKWPTFISDMTTAARTDQKICENNLQILNLLSEDILDFGEQEMTSDKASELKTQLGQEFRSIFDLCLSVLGQYHENAGATSPALMERTLQCLRSFIRWNAPDYVFQTDLPAFLMSHFWDPLQYRQACVECLAELFAHTQLSDTSIHTLTQAWLLFLDKCAALPQHSFEYETKVPTNMRVFWESLYQALTIAVSTFAKAHFQSVCQGQSPAAVAAAQAVGQNLADGQVGLRTLELLVKFSQLPSDEAFKICLEFWHNFCKACHKSVKQSDVRLGYEGAVVEASLKMLRQFQHILTDVRRVLIARMARPPEVYIVYDEDAGTVERDYQPDTDEIALYNLMKQTLILLAHLGPKETEQLFIRILKEFTEGVQRDRAQQDWNPTLLNRLCWAMGSIAGALPPDHEKTFLIQMLKSLLWFCDVKRGKENKALIASMIMYINGQYPRFLKTNENLLRVVVNKTFDFMSETFPGVQDMACETFHKISQGCKDKLSKMMYQPESTDRFVKYVLDKLPELSASLSTNKQNLLLYQSVAIIISAAEPEARSLLLLQLMALPNQEWKQAHALIMQTSIENLELRLVRRVTEILQINERVADAVGVGFDSQFVLIFPDLLSLYTLYGQHFVNLVAKGFAEKLRHAIPKEMRSTRRAGLRLIETFVQRAAPDSLQVRTIIVEQVLPPLLAVIAVDFRDSLPELRDAEVLTLSTTLVKKLNAEILLRLPELIECVFLPALDMINKDFDSYPEMRLTLFEFEQTCVEHCFESVLHLSEAHLNKIVASLIFAFQDEKPDVASLGLSSILTLLRSMGAKVETFRSFAKLYFYTLLREILAVLTDTLHSAGFREQCAVLQELAKWSISPMMDMPQENLTRDAIMRHMATLLTTAFPNLNQAQIEMFIVRLLSSTEQPLDTFSLIAHDLIIQLKEIADADGGTS